MQFVNKQMSGRQEVGHIDLLSKFSYIEVPEKDAEKVMHAINGADYKGREVRCNDADSDEKGERRAPRSDRRETRGGDRRGSRDDRWDSRSDRPARRGKTYDKSKRYAGSKDNDHQQDSETDWRELMKPKKVELKGEEPDFSEDGWARRRPRKK